MRSRKERRRRAQAGTTLIELLVSIMIIGLVVVVLVGSFSTALIDATLVKRNTAVSAAQEYEVEKIGASTYNSSPAPYSECFAVDAAVAPTMASGGSCPAGTNLRADITETDFLVGLQLWAVQIETYPALSKVGEPVSVYKASR
jgi:hypothetical protein